MVLRPALWNLLELLRWHVLTNVPRLLLSAWNGRGLTPMYRTFMIPVLLWTKNDESRSGSLLVAAEMQLSIK